MKKNILNVKKILLDMDRVVVDDLDMFKQLCPTIVNIQDHFQILTINGKKQEFIYPLIQEAIQRNLFEKAKPTLFYTALKDLLIPFWKSLGIEVEILSSTMKVNPLKKELTVQKLNWNKKYFPDLKVNLSEGSGLKQNWAEEGTLLIDDYDRTIGQFIRAGGYGIQYTTLNNTMYQLNLIGLTP